ncbi:hypothetical protein GCM10023319_23980 [Nocardia iowensis]
MLGLQRRSAVVAFDHIRVTGGDQGDQIADERGNGHRGGQTDIELGIPPNDGHSAQLGLGGRQAATQRLGHLVNDPNLATSLSNLPVEPMHDIVARGGQLTHVATYRQQNLIYRTDRACAIAIPWTSAFAPLCAG